MARSILQKVEGFTPLIDILVDELGLVRAAVYGAIWRYCQMGDGVCTASMEKIARRAGVATKTARRHAAKLCKAEYLEDLTPNRRNGPHVYRDTGTVIIEGLLRARRLDRESNQNEEVGQRVQPDGQRVQPGLDRESNEDTSLRDFSKEKGKDEISSLWSAVKESLKRTMTNATYEAHFARAEPISLENGVLTVTLPNSRSMAWVERMKGRVRRAMLSQHGVEIVFREK